MFVGELPPSERTRATELRYQNDKLAGLTVNLLDEAVINQLSPNWAIKQNRYPYDEAWEHSEMLVFSRACSWADLTKAERLELMELMPWLLTEYDAVKFNGVRLQSVRAIPHIHLLTGLKIKEVSLKEDLQNVDSNNFPAMANFVSDSL